jgi:alpha-L-rhamnosidase
MSPYYKSFVYILSLFLSVAAAAQVQVRQLRCDNRVEPLGLGNLHPGLSWQLEGEGRNVLQSAYEIRVGIDSGSLARGGRVAWSSDKVNSPQSVHVAYGGEPLLSGRRYFWQVRVWDETGRASPWSPVSHWAMGLLAFSDWKASWISPGYTEDSLRRPSPLLRRGFNARGRAVRATLYITAHGLYEARINGQRVGDARLTPGYTEYDHRLYYQAYDVTPLIHKGPNTAAVLLGDGWYRGVFGPWNHSNNYGRDASLLFQLVMDYRDGTSDTLCSDAGWKSATGGIRYADLYNGEIYDARLEPSGWMQPGFDDKGWAGVTVQPFSSANLVASVCEPVREGETFAPVRIFTSPRGERILDFGQNLAGWVRCQLRGRAGDTIKLSHAEVLDRNGNFYTGNLREARAQDLYVLSGAHEEVFEPHFTFHGFRYVKIEGYTDTIRPSDFRSVALYSALPVTGTFHCSDSLVNRLQQNIVWSQQSNFIDIPTDCPQRSERLGWTGDAQMFAATAAFNRRVDGFFEKWLRDLETDQGKDGGMPNVVPDIVNRTLHRAPKGVAGWGDAAVIIPWTLFEVYNDTARLAESYASMQAWVKHIRKNSPGGLWKGGGYGDWLAPDPVIKKGEDTLKAIPTDLGYISQCFYYYSASLLAKAAGVLGKTPDSLYYTALMDTAQSAFLREYVTPDARAISGTQTAYVLALYTGILPSTMAVQAAGRLVELVHANQDHLGTGFLGTPYLCPVLTRYGYERLAYTLLLQTTPPSWLYPVKKGATTIWEKWQALLPNDSIDESSFNHYAYGAIGNWLYSEVAGIGAALPGYKRIVIHPHIDGPLNEADASYQSDYGVIGCGWEVEPGRLTMHVVIPANTRAEVWIPAADVQRVLEQGKALATLAGAHLLPSRDGCVVIELGSGAYGFTVTR